VKRYVEETGSAAVREILASRPCAVSRLSEVEVASAFARRFREGTLPAAERDRALAALRIDLSVLYVVELLPEIAEASVGLLTRHPLRGGDAIQLASFAHVLRHAGGDVRLVAHDSQVVAAARAERFPVLEA
jgi:predicted nucleic acid-binding protein